ncbi:MAG: YhcN/YlaJ family sporulation lipoprotein [Bacillota bacterium]
MKVSRLPAVVLIGSLVLLASLGCTPQRRPDMGSQGQGNPPAPTAPAPARPLPTNPAESNRLAEGLAGEALKVQGVDKATVVLTGSTALVGVNLKSGADPNTVKKEVTRVIQKADNRIKNVLVSTDPELNQRIVRISKGVAEGRPISGFSREISELIKRLSPTAR